MVHGNDYFAGFRMTVGKCLILGHYVALLVQFLNVKFPIRDVPDPDSTIRYPVKCRHPVLPGIRMKFAGYLPDSTVIYFITNIKWKT